MSLESNKYKIIFLVDVSLVTRQNKDDKNVDATINLISASALKLLLHFTTHVKDEKKQLQWGFKFYNVHNQRYAHRNIFRDVETKGFDEFESDLEQLFEYGFNHQHLLLSRSKKDYSEKKSFGNTSTDAGCDRGDMLATQLKNIICDFQWYGPDICSPVKVSRRRSALLPPSGESLNAVFVFTDCPHSISDVTSFATCDETISAKDFLAEILPYNVFQQFHIIKGLRLFWIDTDALPNEACTSASLPGIALVNEALTKVGGCVIPACMLVQNGSQASANILHALSCCEKVSSAVSAPILAVKTIVEHYTSLKALTLPAADSTISAILTCGSLNESQRDERLAFPVHLQPILQSRSRASCNADSATNTSAQSSSSSSSSSSSFIASVQVRPASALSGRDSSSPPLDLQVIPPAAPPPQEDSGNPPHKESGGGCGDSSSETDWRIETVATLAWNRLPLSCLDAAYVLTEQVEEATGGQQYLGSLMDSLARRNQILVVTVSQHATTTTTTSLLAVLQPLTSVSATLTLLKSSSSSVWLDKALCFPPDVTTASGRQIEGKLAEEVETFVREKCAAVIPLLEFAQSHTG